MASEAVKIRCYAAYHNALNAGRLMRPGECSRCQVECVPDGHHTDYEKPLDVAWICRQCHAAEHRATRIPRPKKAMRRFEFHADDALLHQIDAARGLIPRAAWIKDVLSRELSRLEAEKPKGKKGKP